MKILDIMQLGYANILVIWAIYQKKKAADEILFADFSMSLRPELQKRVDAKDPRTLKKLLEVAAEIEAECPPKKID